MAVGIKKILYAADAKESALAEAQEIICQSGIDKEDDTDEDDADEGENDDSRIGHSEKGSSCLLLG